MRFMFELYEQIIILIDEWDKSLSEYDRLHDRNDLQNEEFYERKKIEKELIVSYYQYFLQLHEETKRTLVTNTAINNKASLFQQHQLSVQTQQQIESEKDERLHITNDAELAQQNMLQRFQLITDALTQRKLIKDDWKKEFEQLDEQKKQSEWVLV